MSCPGAPGQVESSGEGEMLLGAAGHVQMGRTPETQERPGKEGACGRVADWEISKRSRGPARIEEQTQDQVSEMMVKNKTFLETQVELS